MYQTSFCVFCNIPFEDDNRVYGSMPQGSYCLHGQVHPECKKDCDIVYACYETSPKDHWTSELQEIINVFPPEQMDAIEFAAMAFARRKRTQYGDGTQYTWDGAVGDRIQLLRLYYAPAEL